MIIEDPVHCPIAGHDGCNTCKKITPLIEERIEFGNCYEEPARCRTTSYKFKEQLTEQQRKQSGRDPWKELQYA